MVLAYAMGSHGGIPDVGDVRVPIGDVLRGMEIHPLVEGHTPIEAFLLIKVLDDEGDPTWAYRTTNRLNREELLGALSVHVAVLTKELREEWNDHPE